MARPISYDPEQALERAKDLFWRHGYHAVSVELLVRGTGLNRHSLYSRYGNKYGLLRQALDRYCDESISSIRAILEGDAPPRERIAQLLRLRHPETEHEFWRRVMEQGCLATRTVAELRDHRPEVCESLDRIGRTLHAGIRDVLAEARARGEIGDAHDVDVLATVLTAGFMSFSPTPPPDERIDAFLSLLD